MRSRLVTFCISLVFIPRLSSVSLAQDLFSGTNHPGIQTKASAGGGLTVSRGPGAVFSNPANVIFSRFFEPEADIGFSSVSYSYQHNDSETYGPTSTSLMSIQATLGGTVRPILPLAFSFALVPMGLPETKYSVTDAPFHTGDGNYVLSNMDVTQQGMILGGAGAYRLHPLITVGAGIIMTSEKIGILATEPNVSDPFFDMLVRGSFMQFILGSRLDLFKRRVSLGFSYRTQATKNYSGDYYLDTEGEEKAPYQELQYQGHAPAVIGAGAELQLGTFGAFGEMKLKQWSAGLGNRDLPSTATATDYQDSFEVALGGKLWLKEKHMLTGSFGFITPNVGDGSEYQTLPEEGFEGVQLADIESIQRMIFAGGYRLRLTKLGYLMAAGQFQTGSRDVPQGFNYEGTHTVTAFLGSLGASFGF